MDKICIIQNSITPDAKNYRVSTSAYKTINQLKSHVQETLVILRNSILDILVQPKNNHNCHHSHEENSKPPLCGKRNNKHNKILYCGQGRRNVIIWNSLKWLVNFDMSSDCRGTTNRISNMLTHTFVYSPQQVIQVMCLEQMSYALLQCTRLGLRFDFMAYIKSLKEL